MDVTLLWSKYFSNLAIRMKLFQGFFYIWHTVANKLTASLLVSHLHLSFISQMNCTSLVAGLELMLQPPHSTWRVTDAVMLPPL